MSKQHDVSKVQERRITKSLSEIGEEARRQMASGAIWFAKSDVVSRMFQIECKTKTTQSKSITIKKEWLEKIGQEAFENRKIGALAFSFGDHTDYIALRDRDFLAIIEELTELRRRLNESSAGGI